MTCAKGVGVSRRRGRREQWIEPRDQGLPAVPRSVRAGRGGTTSFATPCGHQRHVAPFQLAPLTPFMSIMKVAIVPRSQECKEYDTRAVITSYRDNIRSGGGGIRDEGFSIPAGGRGLLTPVSPSILILGYE